MKSQTKHSVKLKRQRKFKNKKNLCYKFQWETPWIYRKLISKNKLRTLFDYKLYKYHQELLLGPVSVKSCALPEVVVQRCSIKERVLVITRKYLYWSLFIDKVAFWRPGTLLKRDFSTRQNTFWCELVNILLLFLVDIFLLLLLVVLPYQIPDEVFVNPTE